MLRRVENEPVMTVREMGEYYPDNWFRFVILDEASIDYPVEEALARVIFLADTEEELLRIPSEQRYEPGYPSGGDYWGVRVDPEPGIQMFSATLRFAASSHRLRLSKTKYAM